jgi:hypothetical protein
LLLFSPLLTLQSQGQAGVAQQIENNVHLDDAALGCYTKSQNKQTERVDDGEDTFSVPRHDTNIIAKPLIYQHFLRIAR